MRSLIPNHGVRWFFLYAIFLIPFSIAVNSLQHANRITDDPYYKFVERSPGDEFEHMAPSNVPIVFIGRLADTIFVQTLDGTRIGALKPKDGDLLVFTTRKRVEAKRR